ncbi:hypothetical protein PF008_g17142 [Phytophthora fragariae]|uniref:RxLR effector protein n=1 Tax=Phytophthora fragariae TaxID=53985 RepID=A0A6G0R9Z8_9STRA|nr:hypothetical protein PF008_g17142 [Phytophthora fragariae]
MRRSFVLLVVAGVLLAICGAVSASADQTKPGGTALEDGSPSRLLRSHQEADNDVVDEDRGLDGVFRKVFGLKKSDFAKSDLKKALGDENLRLELYKKWDKYSLRGIKLNLKHTDRHHPLEKILFYDYLNKYPKADAIVRGKEGGKTVTFKLDKRDARLFDDNGNFEDKVQRLDAEGKFLENIERLDDAVA